MQYDLAKHASKDGQVEFVTLEGEQTLKTMWKGRELAVRETLQIAGEANGWMVRQVNFIMGTRLIEVTRACRSWEYPKTLRTGLGANT